jgi:hypothetical protein
MNNILPSGKSRVEQNAFDNKISFDLRSTIIGENAGGSLKTRSDAYLQNYFNTFVGYQSGQNAMYAKNNTLIGYNAGNDVYIGSNNIYIGNEVDNKTRFSFRRQAYDVLSVGLNNTTSDNSVTLGSQNQNIGTKNIVQGIKNIVYNGDNIVIGCDNSASNSSSSIIMGRHNILSYVTNSNIANNNRNIIIGSDNITSNVSHSVIVGKQNILYNAANYINIGNNLKYSEKINIGDTFIKSSVPNHDDIIFVGLHSCNITSTAIGFLDDDIDIYSNYSYLASNNQSLYVKNGLYTDKLTLGHYDASNINQYSISLLCPEEIEKNSSYMLPSLPIKKDGMFLTSDDGGNMSWKEIDVQTQIDNNLNLDKIRNGTSNTYIVNGVVKSNLHVDGLLVVNKLQVLGTDVTNYGNGPVKYSANMSNYTIGEVNKKLSDLQELFNSKLEQINNEIISLTTKRIVLQDPETENEMTISFRNNILVFESNGVVFNEIQRTVVFEQYTWKYHSATSAQYDITNIPLFAIVDANTLHSKVVYLSIKSTEIENIILYSIMLILTYNSSEILQDVSFHVIYAYYSCDTLETFSNLIFFSENSIEVNGNNLNIELTNHCEITMIAKDLNIGIPTSLWKKETSTSTQYDISVIPYKHIDEYTRYKAFNISIISSQQEDSVVLYSAIVYSMYNSSNVFIGIFYHLLYSHKEPFTIHEVTNNNISNEVRFANNSIKIDNSTMYVTLDHNCRITMLSTRIDEMKDLKIPFWAIKTSENIEYDISELSNVKTFQNSAITNKSFDVSIYTNDFFAYSVHINVPFDIIYKNQYDLELTETYSYLPLDKINKIYKNEITVGISVFDVKIQFSENKMLIETQYPYQVSVVSY